MEFPDQVPVWMVGGREGMGERGKGERGRVEEKAEGQWKRIVINKSIA